MYLNTSVRSRFAPDMPFIFTASADYLGEKWADEEATESSLDLSKLASNITEIIKSWSLVILSVIISGIFLNKSLNDRRRRKVNEELRKSMYNKQAPEKVQDWMDKFKQDDNSEREVVQSKQIPADTFQNVFRARAGMPQQASIPVEEPLRKAASTVLDVHDKSMVIGTADDLLEEINTIGLSLIHI